MDSIPMTLIVFVLIDLIISIILTLFIFDGITSLKYMDKLPLTLTTSILYGLSNVVILITIIKHRKYKDHIHY